MDNFFNQEKLSIIEFLQKHEGYKIFYHGQKKQKDTYLFQATAAQFQIVLVTNSYTGALADFPYETDVYKQLKAKLLKKKSHLKIKILVLILGNQAHNIIKKDWGTLVMLNLNYKSQLNEIFSQFTNFFQEKEIDLKDVPTSELMEQMQSSSSKFSRDAVKVAARLRSSNLIIFWIVLLLFVVAPLLLLIFSGSIFKNLTGDSLGLALGGVNRDLLVGFNQWWRLFTYFLGSDNIFLLLLFGLILCLSVKYLEVVMKPWKIALAFLILLPGAVFLPAICSPNTVFGGPAMIGVAIYGLMTTTNYSRTNLTARITSGRIWLILLLLVLIPLGTEHFIMYVFFAIDFMAGATLAVLFHHNYHDREHNWIMAFPILLMITLFVVPIILYNINQYWPANNSDVFSMLQQYYNQGLMSKSSIIKVLENYYHIPPGSIPNYITF